MDRQDKQVRFGLVGCGRIGARADERVSKWPLASTWLPYSHAAAIVAARDAQLVAVCDPDRDAAEQAADQFGCSAVYTDCADMLARERLDGVAVATRTPERPPVIEAAVGAGVRGIYCEKPIANTLEDADRLARLITERQVSFGYGTKRRFMPVYERARDAISAGCIGELQTIIIHFGTAGLLWNHPHSVDLASFFARDAAVASVQAELEGELGTGSLVDADPMVRAAHLVFTNGVRAEIVAAESQDVQLCGSRGVLTVRSDGLATHWRTPLSDGVDLGWLLAERLEPTPAEKSGTVRSIEALVDAVLGRGSSGYEVGCAVHNLEVLFAMVESHLADGRRVNLPLPRRGLRVTGRSGDRYA